MVAIAAKTVNGLHARAPVEQDYDKFTQAAGTFTFSKIFDHSEPAVRATAVPKFFSPAAEPGVERQTLLRREFIRPKPGQAVALDGRLHNGERDKT
jgi:hypothetical protein